MSIVQFDNEDEFDEEFERIEDLNMDYLQKKEEVKDLKEQLEEAERERDSFYEDNKEFILMP